MEVCSSAPLEVEALKLVVVSLLVSPGKVTVVNSVKKVMSIMWKAISSNEFL